MNSELKRQIVNAYEEYLDASYEAYFRPTVVNKAIERQKDAQFNRLLDASGLERNEALSQSLEPFITYDYEYSVFL